MYNGYFITILCLSFVFSINSDRSTRHGGTSNNNRTWSSSNEEEDEAGEIFFFRLIDFLFGHGTAGTASSTAQRKNISSNSFTTNSSSLSPVTNVRVGRSAEVGRMPNQTRQIGHESSASSADGSPEFF